jgi:hypothetical protein
MPPKKHLHVEILNQNYHMQLLMCEGVWPNGKDAF